MGGWSAVITEDTKEPYYPFRHITLNVSRPYQLQYHNTGNLVSPGNSYPSTSHITLQAIQPNYINNQMGHIIWKVISSGEPYNTSEHAFARAASPSRPWQSERYTWQPYWLVWAEAIAIGWSCTWQSMSVNRPNYQNGHFAQHILYVSAKHTIPQAISPCKGYLWDSHTIGQNMSVKRQY